MHAVALTFDATVLVVGLLAFLQGGRPEKVGALINAIGVILSSGARMTGLTSWQAGGLTLWIDVSVMLAFFWLACRTIRFWPIWSFGFVLSIIAIDVAKLALPDIGLRSFAHGQVLCAYLALGSLVIGTRSEARGAPGALHGFRTRC